MSGTLASSLRSRLVVLSCVLFVASLSACESVQERVSKQEDTLSAAGFIVKPANTPAREAMLVELPADRFVRRVNGDTIHYVYADPVVCGCLYVGTQDAYNKFKADELARNLVDEQLLTAQTYSDASWDWGAWGPWGGYPFAYGGFGW
jgi:hypothetical protein